MSQIERQYFSQNGEDYLLWQLFGSTNQGFFVDVGAFDGVHLSNTYSFERAGWSGICIEAHPRVAQRCSAARPRSVCIQSACMATGQSDSAEFMAEPLGLLSGLAPDEQDVRRRYEKRGLEFPGFEKLRVPVTTLDAVLGEHLPLDTTIDLLSVDVEGLEPQVFDGFDLLRYRPRIMVVEANTDEVASVLRTRLVQKRGYLEARWVARNLFLAREKADAEILASTPIDCWLEASPHPLGGEYTPPLYAGRRRVIHRPTGRKRSTLWPSARRRFGRLVRG